jgi:predicted metal-dependent hydrolase
MDIHDTITYGGNTIPYDITFSGRRKTVVIVIHRNRRVEVKAPPWVEKSAIRKWVFSKSPWIIKRLSLLDAVPDHILQRAYKEGEPFLFLGAEYYLKIVQGEKSPKICILGSDLEVHIPPGISGSQVTDYIISGIEDWYRMQALHIISEKVRDYSAVLRIRPPEFRVKNIKKRWGSCSQKDHLNFNLRLVMAPADQIEYVVLHELCHILHKNHSSQFWKAVANVMPDYQGRRAQLKRKGWSYVL